MYKRKYSEDTEGNTQDHMIAVMSVRRRRLES